MLACWVFVLLLVFLDDLNNLFLLHVFLITGNFNLHINDLTNPHTKRTIFTRRDSTSFKQHACSSIHLGNHILDLVITHAETFLQSNITFLSLSFRPSSYFIFSFNLSSTHSSSLSFRYFRSINN
jgi:hypothetical protein